MKESWVVLEIMYKYGTLKNDSDNEVVNVKMITDPRGYTKMFDSFDDAQNYIVPVSKEHCAYKFVQVG